MMDVMLDSFTSSKLNLVKGTGAFEWDYTFVPINQASLSFKSVTQYVLCVDVQYTI